MFVKVMMETLVPLILGLLLITQVLYPMITPNVELFWLFKKNGKKKLNDLTNPLEDIKKGIDLEVEGLTQEVVENAEKLKQSTGKVDEVVSKLTEVKNNSLNNLNQQK